MAQRRQDNRFNLRSAQYGCVNRLYSSVDANTRRRAGNQQQVAAISRYQQLEKAVQSACRGGIRQRFLAMLCKVADCPLDICRTVQYALRL